MDNEDQNNSEESFCFLEVGRPHAWRGGSSTSSLHSFAGVARSNNNSLGGSEDRSVPSGSSQRLSPSIQRWLGEVDGGGSRDVEEIDNELGRIVGSIMRIPKRKRILHDIIPGDVESLSQFVKLLTERIKSFQGGFVIISKHYKPGFEHLHVVHDCNYYNSQCRYASFTKTC